ncbi:MAG: peptidoglycan-binding protein [Firmicutes bacterium]|nr:peptidoglycan-binding protein [Bacillota bacterium]
MTIEQAKSKLLAWVSAQVGAREGANNYNKYAEDPRLTQLYGMDMQHQPWCDLFTDAAFINVFGLELGAAMTYQQIGSGSAACRTSAQFFRDHGAFSQYPEPGDIIFFFASGAINHQGIVMRVAGGSVVTVEGNSSDQVAERVYQIGDSSIAGYGRPDWRLAAGAEGKDVAENATTETPDSPTIDPPPEMIDVKLPVLHNGMGGSAVAAMQGILHYRKYSLGPYGVDGEFGTATLAALRNFQIRNELDPDGMCGPETWKHLLS